MWFKIVPVLKKEMHVSAAIFFTNCNLYIAIIYITYINVFLFTKIIITLNQKSDQYSLKI